MTNIRVIIAGGFLFPYGGATASRVRNLALGLHDCGAQVHVVTISPHESATQLSAGAVIPFEGITYECPSAGQRSRPARLRNRLLDKPRWFLQTYQPVIPAYRAIRRRIAENGCDLIYAYDRSAVRLVPLAKLARRHGAVSLLDIVEIHTSFAGLGGKLSPVYWDWVLGAHLAPRSFDGLTVITTGLEQLHTERGHGPVLVIPSVESWDDLPAPPATSCAGPFRLLYLGALIARDAPDLLLDAIRILAERDVPVVLDVVGRFQDAAEGRQWANLCREDQLLRERVNLVGSVSDDELAERLRSADGLVLLRRNAPTEVCSFPTRLVEYLKQGCPVLVSDVGDVGRYLRHGVDAILVDPEDSHAVAASIQELVMRPDRGRTVGLQGQARGVECFDRRKHAARLLEFAARIRAGEKEPAGGL